MYGECKPQLITFAIESSMNREYSHHQGEKLPLKCIAGYRSKKDHIMCAVSPGSSMFYILIPSISFQGFAHQLSGERLLNLMNNTNALRINDPSFLNIITYCKQNLIHTPNSMQCTENTHDCMLLMHDILASNSVTTKIQSPSDRTLVKDFIKLALSNELEYPITINDLSKNLFTSKTNLSSQIKKSTGLSPMNFIKCVRLEQVRSDLIRSEGHASIGDVASKYGFTSRGHFARDYQQLFGERPTDTLSHF